MSRHELLEQILEARYELDYAPREAKAARQRALYELVDKAISSSHTHASRSELLHSLHERYMDYKREKRRKEKIAISQRLRS